MQYKIKYCLYGIKPQHDIISLSVNYISNIFAYIAHDTFTFNRDNDKTNTRHLMKCTIINN